MSKKSLAKTHDEMLIDLINEYRAAHGPCSMEDVSAWILSTGKLEAPKVDPGKALTRKLKLAARRKRMKDAQGRTVRELVAAKIERVDERGNMVMDVVWDHLHQMSMSHALLVFHQRDELIEKQCQSATRDLQSCLENNPNLAGAAEQFEFAFMRDEVFEPPVEEISESARDPIVRRQH